MERINDPPSPFSFLCKLNCLGPPIRTFFFFFFFLSLAHSFSAASSSKIKDPGKKKEEKMDGTYTHTHSRLWEIGACSGAIYIDAK
jgi:hypothetical protein